MAIRILIVDDSATARRFLAAIVQSDAELELVGMAEDGLEGVALAAQLKPDVVLMDLNMPGLMGHEATARIMAEAPTHVIICTSGTTGADATHSYDAIKAGGMAAVDKPMSPTDVEASRTVISTIKLIAQIPVRGGPGSGGLGEEAPLSLITTSTSYRIRGIGIAAGSGGSAVLQAVLSRLPADFPIPILVIQHKTAGFAEGLVEWLASNVALPVRLARHGEHLPTRCVLVAPDDYHLRVNPLRQIELTQTLPVRGQRPAATILFQSLANVFGASALGLLLSNLGEDGREAMFVMRASGGQLIAQQTGEEPQEGLAQGVISVPAERLAATMMAQIV